MDAPKIDDPVVRACVQRTVPDYSMIQKLGVETVDREGSVSESYGTLSWKRFEDGRAKLVASIAEPAHRAGVASLIVERDNAKSDIWLYIPERRQVRRVGPRTLGNSLLGTDLNYEDFSHFQRIANLGEATRLADSEVDGHPVYVLETIPDADESDYARILTYVDQEICLPLRTEFFAPNGSIHKELYVAREHVRKIGDRWVPFRAVMRDHKRDSRTELVTSDVEINPNIRDVFFTPSELRRGH